MRIWKPALAIAVFLPVIATTTYGKPGAFAVRGIKGLWWEGIANYQKALPWLASHDLNFLMYCYTSFPASAKDWRSDYTPEELSQFQAMARDARRLGVTLCLSFNPAIWSNPPLEYSSESDYAIALEKVRAVHQTGIDWFALCLDDISRELVGGDKDRFANLQDAQTHFTNRLWADMRRISPKMRLIFCPSAYTTEDARNHQDYIRAIGRDLAQEIMVFWTGPTVCSTTITAADAREFGNWIRRKPFVWDNFPVNDMFPWRPLLAPVRGRSADLAGEVSGFMANPMKQWHASALPLATLAEYLNDPADYHPEAAGERVIRSFPPEAQRGVRLLMQLYGPSFWGDPGFPPKPDLADRETASRLLPRYRVLRKELSTAPALASLNADVGETLEQDISAIERKLRDRRTDAPLEALGSDFEGGAGDLYGYAREGREVNYIYARPTGRDVMSCEFFVDTVPPDGAELHLAARNDDAGNHPLIAILWNDVEIFRGASPFDSSGFAVHVFPIPAALMHQGESTLKVQCLEDKGTLGMPPWFMVAEARVVLRK